MKTPTKIREQLEQVLSHNSVEDVLDMLATIIEGSEWVDHSFQVFAVGAIREASLKLKDEDWRRELEGDEPT